jgi:hypothetical protein
MKVVLFTIFGLWIAGGCISSCNPYVANPCDTCNLNQDSLQKIKDSLAHAFEWTEYLDKMPGETSPTGVWVFGPNDIYITGNHLFHFDGISFAEMLLKRISNGTGINVADDRLFAFSKTDFWIVGGNAYHSVDGVHAEDLRPAIDIKSCWGTSSNDMFFVGNGGLIYHYDGTKFSEMISGTTKNINSIWGTSDNNIWAAGFNPNTAESVVSHYDGLMWTSIDVHTIGNIGVGHHALGSIWSCDSANNHHLTIAGGSLLWRHTDDGVWRSDSGSISNRLSDGSFEGIFHIRGNSATDFIAAGDGGFISHWNGKNWKRYDQLFLPDNPSYGTNACSMNGNTICLVGVKNGQSWILIGQRK